MKSWTIEGEGVVHTLRPRQYDAIDYQRVCLKALRHVGYLFFPLLLVGTGVGFILVFRHAWPWSALIAPLVGWCILAGFFCAFFGLVMCNAARQLKRLLPRRLVIGREQSYATFQDGSQVRIATKYLRMRDGVLSDDSWGNLESPKPAIVLEYVGYVSLPCDGGRGMFAIPVGDEDVHELRERLIELGVREGRLKFAEFLGIALAVAAVSSLVWYVW